MEGFFGAGGEGSEASAPSPPSPRFRWAALASAILRRLVAAAIAAEEGSEPGGKLPVADKGEIADSERAELDDPEALLGG